VFKRKTIKLKQFQPISNARNRTKPYWVIDKVIYLKALMPNCGCGTVAMTFNRLYSEKGETVSKTFVYEKLKANAYQVKCKRRDIKSRQPKASAINQTWGIDLTTVTICGKKQLILGIVDHGSRALLCLQSLNSKHSIVIIRELISIIKKCGFPKKIRTDNEVCFTSSLIRFSLALLGIKHQTSDVACPWQNGRIERCFGTFKQKWQLANITNKNNLQTQLTLYQNWYNGIRPHSHLDGKTPKEVYLNRQPKGAPLLVSGWNGVLTGYYFPD
jgi:transposase InsO family protein